MTAHSVGAAPSPWVVQLPFSPENAAFLFEKFNFDSFLSNHSFHLPAARDVFHPVFFKLDNNIIRQTECIFVCVRRLQFFILLKIAVF